ncbi:MFS transporter [Rhodoluna sp.]|uniref:MFS transporter n=1 Tax=Rhodoluna sp. TaxID=1969481 RepID=UPI0025D6753A|nr:MFS transporter [Rhodoluna sp.]
MNQKLDQAQHVLYKHRWLVLTVVLIVEIMDLLDSTIVNVGGPSLAKYLNANSTALQWVIGGYTLALGSGLILGGRLGDRFGRRNMFLFGLIGFTIASLACALAPNVETLIALRLVQGFFGAMLLPQGFGLIRDVFPPQEFGKAFALYGPAFGLGGILGPIIGGFLIEANILDLAWRSVFLVNVPIGLVAAVLAYKYIPKSAPDKSVKIDVRGALLVVVASGMLVYPLMTGQEFGWPAWIFVILVGSLVMFYVFATLERKTVGRGEVALIDADIFKKRSYTLGLGGLALYFAGFTGIYLILTLFLQFGEQFTSAEAGLGNIPIAVGSAIGGGISGGFLAEKIGGRLTLQIGAAIQFVGVGLMWFALPTADNFSIWQLVPALVVSGIGTGLIAAPIFDTILSTVDSKLAGSASGVMSAVQSVFSSVGVAIFGTVFFNFALAGDAAEGFRNALLIQVVIVALFMVLTLALPKRIERI